MKIHKSKRLRITLGGLALNFITVWIGIGYNADLTALGTCLMMINTPLYVYVFGESFRKSD